ncbi:MAG: hypothetical protein IT198_14140 [Acidimicrobiia bacterium]|nr:hypothetical protein [Acidimicrobiia bacterium]
MYADMQAALPDRWRGGGYFNYARSGFSTAKVIFGGRDACGGYYPDGTSPVLDAGARLGEHQGSWNRVIITAGIDDTNWGDVLADIAVSSWSWLVPGGLPTYNANMCGANVAAWDGWAENIASSISDGAGIIVSQLQVPGTRVVWVGYFNLAGTGPAPASCSNAIRNATTALHTAIRDELNSATYTWVDVGTPMDSRSDRIQPWYYLEDLVEQLRCSAEFSADCTNPPGWPHPNTNGAQAIADEVDRQGGLR